jgi:hypothetical protein
MGKKLGIKKIEVKRLRKEVQEKLAAALADYKNGLPEKKYSKTLKKASKLFVSSFEKSSEKSKARIEKMPVKAVQEPIHE